MIRVLGEDFLRSGSGIIDVAGGKGELAFEFANLNAIPSTVIDPRAMDLYRFKRKLRFGYYHKNDVLGAYNSSAQPESECSILPFHIRTFFEMSGVGRSIYSSTSPSTLPLCLADADEFSAARHHGERTCWGSKGLVAHEDEVGYDDDEDDIDDEDAESSEICCFGDCAAASVTSSYGSGYKSRPAHGGIVVQDYERAFHLIRDCSAIVGMHPDQAAEHIVSFALRNKRPFAIVPCCVYSKHFPKRKLKDGRHVKVYGDLIEYILEMDSEISALEMDFEGKNVMLYYLGAAAPLADPMEPIAHISRGVATAETWWRLSKNMAPSTTITCSSDCSHRDQHTSAPPDVLI